MGQNRREKKIGIILLSILILSGCFYAVQETSDFRFSEVVIRDIRPAVYLEEMLQEGIMKTHLPSFMYLLEKENSISGTDQPVHMTAADTLMNVILQSVPVVAYAEDEREYETQIEDANAYEAILQNEGADEEAERTEETPMIITPEQDIVDHMTEENAEHETETENEPAIEFAKEDLQDFTYLLGNFYTVDKTTNIDAAQLSAVQMLEKDMHLDLQTKESGPKILIYHTHSQEGYADSIPGDEMTTVVGVGARLTELLTEAGYEVLHHRGRYDVENRDYAYANAEPALEAILTEHPGIEIIIDIHRDGVAENRRLVTEVDGKQMAQFMLFNGLSRTTKLGNIEYLPNPYIEDNLAFAFQLQLKSAEYYPNLARKIYLKGYRYNMHYRPRSLLVEVGAQTNTLEEALNTMEPLSNIIDMVLSGEK
ncbi:MAG: stage II sporulation protein P [bacterium]|nr:stage II sporulation protein P [bacterium]